MRHNWRASLKKFCRLKVLLIWFFPVALSVIFLLVYAKCNFASVFIFFETLQSLLEKFLSFFRKNIIDFFVAKKFLAI